MPTKLYMSRPDEDHFQMHGHSKPDLLSAGLFCDMVGAERKLPIR